MLTAYLTTKACSRIVFVRVSRRTRWPRVATSGENLTGYRGYRDNRDLALVWGPDPYYPCCGTYNTAWVGGRGAIKW